MNSLLPLLFAALGLGLMWVLVVMPQQKRVRAHDEVVRTLEVGAEVVTTSGLCGRIVALDDEFARLEVAPGVVVRFDRRAIGALLDERPGAPAAADPDADRDADPLPTDHVAPPTPSSTGTDS